MTDARPPQERPGLSGLLVACAGALALLLTHGPAASQGSGALKSFAMPQYGFTVSLPESCRHDEGPGTIEAVCSPDLDPERSSATDKLNALILQVSSEIVVDDAGRSAAELAQRYNESAFKDELPEAVCGEADASRAKVENFKSVLEEARVAYTAEVVCAEVKFLQVGKRKAQVRYLISPAARYRLMARAPLEEFDGRKAMIDAFLAGFRPLPLEK